MQPRLERGDVRNGARATARPVMRTISPSLTAAIAVAGTPQTARRAALRRRAFTRRTYAPVATVNTLTAIKNPVTRREPSPGPSHFLCVRDDDGLVGSLQVADDRRLAMRRRPASRVDLDRRT